MQAPRIAEVTFTSPDRVRDVIDNFDTDGSTRSTRATGAAGRRPSAPSKRAEIEKIALGRHTDHGLPFSTWSLPKLAEHLVAEGVVDDISHEGLRLLQGKEGVSFRQVKTWKTSTDPTTRPRRTGSLSCTPSPTASSGRLPVTPRSCSAWTNSAR
jgi:hypothetical protein